MLALGPTASASQLDDLGTNDPTDIEGVDEAPWRAWDVSELPFALPARTDIATGPNGEPYVTWDGIDILLAYPDDGPEPAANFAVTTITDTTNSDPGGIAVQSDGRAWVTYKANGDNDSHYEVYAATAMDPEGEWTRWQLNDYASQPRITIDDAGTVNVVYHDGFDQLHHATYTDDQGWTDEPFHTVDPSGTTDLEIAYAAGRLHVVWKELILDNPDPDTGYAVKALDDPNTEWTVDTIPKDPVYCGYAPDVGAAPDGSAWLSCRGDGGITAWHRTTDGTWSHEQVSDGSNLMPPRRQAALGGGTSIAVDDGGVPHIAFHTDPPFGYESAPTRPGEPQYGARVDGDWTVETIDREAQKNGKTPSITLDDDGRPQASYVMRYRLDPSPNHPCPGCGELNERSQLRHAQPLATTLLNDLPIVAG
jgi:hypothetical protein